MAYSFDRAVMKPKNRAAIGWIAAAGLALTIAGQATARADEVMDRATRFHISPSPLSSALLEFSSQSGLQVAAADADVSRLNSNGVNGTYAPRTALDLLLQGTGLRFSQVGTATVAIGTVPGPAKVASSRIQSAGATAGTPESKPTQPDLATASATEVPDVTVTAPRPPTEEELAGDSLSQFVIHHATVRYFNTGVTGNLARWRGGKQSICPLTDGLSLAQNAYVTARIRALASYVGAPVDTATHCKDNVQILFTDSPREKMDSVIQWATVYFRNRYSGGMKDLIAFRPEHAIQGWYMTTRGGAIVLNTDLEFVGLNVLPVWPKIIQNHLGDERGSGIGVVILVVDTTKVTDLGIGALADYLAMLTLSVVQSPEHCDPLPSILDLVSSGCGARAKPAAMTAGDLAFLKAMYYKHTGLGRSLSRSEIESNMMRQFKDRQ
jgi:hypothetical protein